MNVNVRLSGDLALPDNATASDLVTHLQEHYPAAAARFTQAVPIVAGQHISPETTLRAGQEVALLLPIAGG